jgi:hypothetical protein
MKCCDYGLRIPNLVFSNSIGDNLVKNDELSSLEVLRQEKPDQVQLYNLFKYLGQGMLKGEVSLYH